MRFVFGGFTPPWFKQSHLRIVALGTVLLAVSASSLAGVKTIYCQDDGDCATAENCHQLTSGGIFQCSGVGTSYSVAYSAGHYKKVTSVVKRKCIRLGRDGCDNNATKVCRTVTLTDNPDCGVGANYYNRIDCASNNWCNKEYFGP
jgi:hypothetical protein